MEDLNHTIDITDKAEAIPLNHHDRARQLSNLAGLLCG
jgi:hypothetical protein